MTARLACCFCLVFITIFAEAAPPRTHITLPQDLAVNDMAVDAAGNIYVCGTTTKPRALGTNVVKMGKTTGTSGAFVLKLSPQGIIVSGTLLNQFSEAQPEKIAVNAAGDVFVAGSRSLSTDSTAVFVGRLDSSCRSMLASALVTNSANSFIQVKALATDSGGNVFIGGIMSGQFDGASIIGITSFYGSAFVVKVAPSGATLFVTMFGGSLGATIEALTVDGNGELYAAGWTQSDDFPGSAAGSLALRYSDASDADGFLVKLAPDGKSLLSSMLIGGACDDLIYALALDPQGNIYLGGGSCSTEWPRATPSDVDTSGTPRFRGIVTKIDRTGTNVLSSRFIDVTGNDQVTALTIETNGVVYAGGIAGKRIDSYSSSYYYPVSDQTASSQPFVAVGDPAEGFTIAPDGRCGEVSDHYAELHFGGKGNMYVLSRTFRSTDAVIERVLMKRLLEETNKARLLLRTPAAGMITGTHGTVVLQAVVSAGSNAIPQAPIQFFDGRRLIGRATSQPFRIVVTNWARGVHVLSATTTIEGQQLRSCAVPIRVRSIRNDNFADRIRKQGERFVAHGSMEGATAEPFDLAQQSGNVTSAYSVSNADVWFSWTAPRDGLFEFEVESRAFIGVEIYSGSVLTNLHSASDNWLTYTRARLQATNGVTYQIRVNSTDPEMGRYKLSLKSIVAPPNDQWSKAAAISGAPISVPADLRNASADPDQDFLYANTIWFLWTAPESGSYIATVEDPMNLTGLAVYSGNAISNFVDRGSELSGSTMPGVAFHADAGEELYVAVTTGDGRSNAVLRIDQSAPPINDQFADRIRLFGPSITTNGTTLGATLEQGEPAAWSDAGSIWWSWTAPSSHVYSIAVEPRPRPNGGFFRPFQLRSPPLPPVLPGQSVAPLIVYSGDQLATMHEIATAGIGGNSEAIFMAEGGVTYQIRIAEEGLADFILAISPVTRPLNDNFADAVVLSGRTGIQGTFRGATIEPGEPTHAGSYYAVELSVWYIWSAPSDGVYAIDLSEYIAAADIYAGGSLESLTLLGRAQSRFVFRAEAGLPYAIAALPRYGGTGGSSDFTLRITAVSPPANDEFSNRTIVEGSDVRMTSNGRNATAEAGEASGSRSLWWSWTAPTNGTFVLEASNNVAVSVRLGDSIGNLQRVASSLDGALTFQAVAGTTYVVGADLSPPYSYWWVDNDVADLHLYYVASPPNDDFANAIPISTAEFSVTAIDSGATSEPDEPNHGYSPASRSVWWTWTPPIDEIVVLTARGAASDAELGIYTGTLLTNLQALRSTTGSTVIQVQSNVTYYIRVDEGSHFGAVTVAVHQVQRPINDDFAGRLALQTGAAKATFTGATTEAAEPYPRNGTNGESVWFTWRSPSAGAFMLERLDPIFGNEPVSFPVDVLTGDSLQSLASVPLEQVSARNLGRTTTWPYDSRYTLYLVESGRDYAIRITAPVGAVARFRFSVNLFSSTRQ